MTLLVEFEMQPFMHLHMRHFRIQMCLYSIMLGIFQAVMLGFRITLTFDLYNAKLELEHPIKPEMTSTFIFFNRTAFLLFQSAERTIPNKKVLAYHSSKIDSNGIRTKKQFGLVYGLPFRLYCLGNQSRSKAGIWKVFLTLSLDFTIQR